MAFPTRGALACFVVERAEFPQMVFASDGGDPTAATLRTGIGLWTEVAFGPDTPSQQCVNCTHVFNDHTEVEAWFLAVAQGDADSFICGLCKPCVRKIGSDGLLARAAEHFTRMWPNAKITGLR